MEGLGRPRERDKEGWRIDERDRYAPGIHMVFRAVRETWVLVRTVVHLDVGRGQPVPHA